MESWGIASREGSFSIPTSRRKATLSSEMCLCLTFSDIKEVGDFPPKCSFALVESEYDRQRSLVAEWSRGEQGERAGGSL